MLLLMLADTQEVRRLWCCRGTVDDAGVKHTATMMRGYNLLFSDLNRYFHWRQRLSVSSEGSIDLDRSKGELRVIGRRHIAIDGESLCNHLDRLCGSKVAEVIINQYEYRLGMEDAEGHRKAKPNATIQEIVKVVEEEYLVSGFGVTEVALPDDASLSEEPISVEIFNPCVKTTSGAGKAILTAYWCGVMAFLLGRHLEAPALMYDPTENSIKFNIVVRG